jgi:hypothetical protein
MFRPRQPTMENYMHGLCCAAGAVLLFWTLGGLVLPMFTQGFGDFTFLRLNHP